MRILGIDYGDVRVGLALSDETGFLASGIGTVTISGMRDAVSKIASVIAERGVGKVVLGLPLNMDGTEGASAQKIKAFASLLSSLCPDVPIEYYDERLTTVLAADYMDLTGTFGKKRKQAVDTLSAQILLQNYLDKNR